MRDNKRSEGLYSEQEPKIRESSRPSEAPRSSVNGLHKEITGMRRRISGIFRFKFGEEAEDKKGNAA